MFSTSDWPNAQNGSVLRMAVYNYGLKTVKLILEYVYMASVSGDLYLYA
jgi:hypothetical protein